MSDIFNGEDFRERSYCFLFHNYEMLVKEVDGEIRIPLASEVSKLSLNISEPIYIGNIGNREYHIAKIIEKDSVEGYTVTRISKVYENFDEDEYSMFLRGMHILNWIDKNSYCSLCREKVQVESVKGKIKCPKCGHSFYTSIAPAVIVAVVRENRVLLARSSKFPPGVFSLVSGFLEPGESLESCVKREVKEEVGIDIDNIKYFGSQPWPFPGSIMVGFTAQYLEGEIVVDNEEIENAQWFSLDELPKVPGKMSIAGKIIDWLVEERKK